VIYRCTARFLQSFDALDAAAQAQALLALRGFAETPRQPSPYAHVVSDLDPDTFEDDVWDIPLGDGCHLTYSFTSGDDPEHFVCVLRSVGRVG
jgi:hypothetical protein